MCKMILAWQRRSATKMPFRTARLSYLLQFQKGLEGTIVLYVYDCSMGMHPKRPFCGSPTHCKNVHAFNWARSFQSPTRDSSSEAADIAEKSDPLLLRIYFCCIEPLMEKKPHAGHIGWNVRGKRSLFCGQIPTFREGEGTFLLDTDQRTFNNFHFTPFLMFCLFFAPSQRYLS